MGCSHDNWREWQPCSILASFHIYRIYERPYDRLLQLCIVMLVDHIPSIWSLVHKNAMARRMGRVGQIGRTYGHFGQIGPVYLSRAPTPNSNLNTTFLPSDTVVFKSSIQVMEVGRYMSLIGTNRFEFLGLVSWRLLTISYMSSRCLNWLA